MFRPLINCLKGLLFPRSSCDEGALLNAAARGNADEFVEILGSSNPDMRLKDGSSILSNVAISQFMNGDARLKVLHALKNCGATIDIVDKCGITPLMLAVGTGEEAFCQALLDLGASTTRADASGDTVLIWAASTNKLPSLQLFIRRGAKVNHQNAYRRTALMYAARQGNLIYLRELIDAGAEVNALDRNGVSALMSACSTGKESAAKFLADYTPEHTKDLSLHLAASVGFNDIVALKAKDENQLLRKNENGFTALELAVIFKQRSTVELLLPLYGKSPDITGLALASAALNNSLELMELLLNRGADPNVADELGNTALILAAERNHADAVALLLRSGANKRQKNHNQDDAQDVAQAYKAYDALQALFKAT